MYGSAFAETLSMDRATHRHKDVNGFLHVAISHISKETVNPYYGHEVPGWEKLGLDPDKIYKGYRKGEELAKGADTFNGLPLLLGHYPESADDPQKEHRVGSLGTDAAFVAPYLNNSLIITDAEAIEAIENGEAVEISSAYRYDPVFEAGEFEGEAYDFIMTNIRGNHVALVEEGRAGPEVAVADGQITKKPMNPMVPTRYRFMNNIKKLAKRLLVQSGLAADEAEVVEAAEKLVEAIGLEVAKKALEESNPDSFDSAAAGILNDAELDEAGKIAALRKLSEGQESGQGQPAKQPETPASPANQEAKDSDISEECAAQMKAAGLDPADAAATKAFMAGLKAAGGVSDAEPATGAAGSEGSAKGQAVEDACDKPLTAKDAALIRKQAKQEAAGETRAHLRSLTEAAKDVRDLCGELDPFAFDSAADTYRHALKAAGISVTTKDESALRDMVRMALDAKANAFANAKATPGFDSSKMDGNFAGLNRINLQ